MYIITTDERKDSYSAQVFDDQTGYRYKLSWPKRIPANYANRVVVLSVEDIRVGEGSVGLWYHDEQALDFWHQLAAQVRDVNRKKTQWDLMVLAESGATAALDRWRKEQAGE